MARNRERSSRFTARQKVRSTHRLPSKSETPFPSVCQPHSRMPRPVRRASAPSRSSCPGSTRCAGPAQAGGTFAQLRCVCQSFRMYGLAARWTLSAANTASASKSSTHKQSCSWFLASLAEPDFDIAGCGRENPAHSFDTDHFFPLAVQTGATTVRPKSHANVAADG
jgi:hypothetical protein